MILENRCSCRGQRRRQLSQEGPTRSPLGSPQRMSPSVGLSVLKIFSQASFSLYLATDSLAIATGRSFVLNTFPKPVSAYNVFRGNYHRIQCVQALLNYAFTRPAFPLRLQHKHVRPDSHLYVEPQSRQPSRWRSPTPQQPHLTYHIVGRSLYPSALARCRISRPTKRQRGLPTSSRTCPQSLQEVDMGNDPGAHEISC